MVSVQVAGSTADAAALKDFVIVHARHAASAIGSWSGAA